MKRAWMSGLAVWGLLAVVDSVSAQVPVSKTIIRDSGNGVNNTIVARNGGPIAGIAWPVAPGYLGQPGLAIQGGWAAPLNGPAISLNGPGFFGTLGWQYPTFGNIGGRNQTIIRDSGNGVGNTILSRNGGNFGYSWQSPYPHLPGMGGININVIANSGNGSGNVISTGNTSTIPGQINVNVITNSGNGVGNVIRSVNR